MSSRRQNLIAAVLLASGSMALAQGETKHLREAQSQSDDQWQVVRPGQHEEYNQRQRLVLRGKAVYEAECIGCHGVNGDGQGPAARRLIVKPRDFSKGVFKFRSTRQLQLPLEADLHRTITKGLPGVSMPAFPLMPEPDRVAVIEYIKQFYPDWKAEALKREVVHVPRAPQDLMTPERIMRGRVVYLAMQCGRCHGTDGAGMNAAIGHVEDAALGSVRPRNFTRGRFRGGDDPEDVYRTFHTGLGGVMPKFDDSVLLYVNQQTAAAQTDFMFPGELEKLKPAMKQFPASPGDAMQLDAAGQQNLVLRNSWDLVAYVLSLTSDPKPTAPAPATGAAPTPGTPDTPAEKAADEDGGDYGY